MSRSIAVAAYVAALAAPASANWQDVATGLFDCLPKSRGVTVEAGAPAWWATYKLGKQFRFDSMEVLFHDGEVVRVTVATAPGKLPLIPSAVRGAIGFYRARNGQNVAVPAFASLTMVDTGQTYDAATASRLTAELRAVPGTVLRKVMTVERIEWMAREVERRRAGYELAASDMAGAEASPFLASLTGEAIHFRRNEMASISGRVDMWRSSLAHGETDLAMMREEFARQRGGADAVELATVAAPEAVAPVLGRPMAVVAPMDVEEAQAMWCEAVADAYAAPAGWEVTGTDPEAEAEANESAPLATTSETNAANVLDGDSETLATTPCAKSATTPAEAIAAPIPAEAIAATASDPAPVLSTDVWEPTPETHPVIALALSDKARAALFDAVLDGTFPAEGNAKAGAWRVTLADALALQGLASIRWVGMPRKAYTRRAAPVVTPAEAIRITTPAEAIPSMPYPAYIPGAGRAPSPVTFHAAP